MTWWRQEPKFSQTIMKSQYTEFGDAVSPSQTVRNCLVGHLNIFKKRLLQIFDQGSTLFSGGSQLLANRQLIGANPYLGVHDIVLAPTVRRLSILLQNHDFRSSAAPWSPADGSVGSRGPAGTFLGDTNRLLRRSAPRGHQKHDF